MKLNCPLVFAIAINSASSLFHATDLAAITGKWAFESEIGLAMIG